MTVSLGPWNFAAGERRGARHRGKPDLIDALLAATKRGGRWLISVEAVRAWVGDGERSFEGCRPRRRSGGHRPAATAMARLQLGANDSGLRPR